MKISRKEYKSLRRRNKELTLALEDIGCVSLTASLKTPDHDLFKLYKDKATCMQRIAWRTVGAKVRI